MATLSSMSLIKKLSLIFNRKAYLIYTNNPIPSLLIPLPSADKAMKSAIYKTFSDLTNDDILTFHNKKIAEKDLNNIDREHKAKLNVESVNLPHQWVIQSVQGVDIRPDSMFLTVNGQDRSLAFMQYEQIQRQVMMAKKDSGQINKNDGEKQKQQQVTKQFGKQDKDAKDSPNQNKKNGKPFEEQFKDQQKFQHQQISTWNQQAPQLSTKPQDQPKEDQQNVHINRFIPLAYLSDYIAQKPIQIIHIQTSRQYLLLQFLKFLCLTNILCVYGLIDEATRSENHYKIKGK